MREPRRLESEVPRQNRVTPFGEIIAVSDRGLFMGNRGCLHDDHGRLTNRRWTRKYWIICQLEFKGRKRSLMTPGDYTELFFLDEPTALAAGHRPCAECRNAAFQQFKELWLDLNSDLVRDDAASITAIDAVLHRERVDRKRQQLSWIAEPAMLPSGAMVKLADSASPWLVWDEALWEWSPGGYRGSRELPRDPVEVVTPRSVVRVLAHGYRPTVHPSLV